MSIRLSRVMRICRRILMAILQAALLAWAACSPLVWILRDGLGPDSVESGWAMSVFKFLVMWGVPALSLAAPLFVLSLVDRRAATGRPEGDDGTVRPDRDADQGHQKRRFGMW
jgi:hypothetical protein